MMDDAGGTPRITYARIIDGIVQAIVVFLPVDAYQEKQCMQVGYAVAPQFRKQGIATETLKQSLTEIQNGFKNKMKSFFVEAVVSVDNTASKKIAERIISPEYKQITDKASGQPALQFFRHITT
ncbi:GNAT family N-acetyltransferase [Massilia sp. B-10]|nr:GNAT family N-acetyltransferase [Massilia sp. B-10]UUZ55072.1 GNAT family N-acetyltransferase [Massilia sp. H-1]